MVDGNVERVLLRVFPEDEKPARPLPRQNGFAIAPPACSIPERPGDFNQSMMELGATVCLPQRPLCLQCPVQPFCTTRGEHQAPPPKKMRSRQIAYALLRRDRAGSTQVLLQRRPLSASLMPGMWELPGGGDAGDDHERVEITLRHAITVTNYRVQVLRFSEQEARHRWPAERISSPMGKEFGTEQLAADRAGAQDPAAVANHAQRDREVR